MPNATLRSLAKLDSFQVRSPGTIVLDATYAVPASTVVGHEIVFARVPTNTRINGTSRIYNTALGASVTLSVGLKAVGGNFTTSNTALSTAQTVAAANIIGWVPFTAPANAGRMVWEYLGLASDPGGFADVIGVTAGATTAAAVHDVTMSLAYTCE